MEDIIKVWKRKWKRLKSNAKQKGVVCTLSFDQYLQLANDAGVNDPSMIGRSIGQYAMGRLGDKGDYELGNCRFIPVIQNHQEKVDNGGSKLRPEVVAKMANTKRGRTKDTDPGCQKQSDTLSGRGIEEFPHLDNRKRRFRVVDPSGNVIESENAKKFSELNGFNPSCFTKMLRGRTESYRGYTGEYI